MFDFGSGPSEFSLPNEELACRRGGRYGGKPRHWLEWHASYAN
jgi:hypothetical protein